MEYSIAQSRKKSKLTKLFLDIMVSKDPPLCIVILKYLTYTRPL